MNDDDGDELGVGVGVGVGVDVVGVGVGGGGALFPATVIVIVVPCGCRVNAGGLWAVTVPGGAVDVLSVTRCERNPAAVSTCSAWPADMPTTFGTFVGPAE